MKPVHEVLSTEALLEQLAEECAELGKAAQEGADIFTVVFLAVLGPEQEAGLGDVRQDDVRTFAQPRHFAREVRIKARIEPTEVRHCRVDDDFCILAEVIKEASDDVHLPGRAEVAGVYRVKAQAETLPVLSGSGHFVRQVAEGEALKLRVRREHRRGQHGTLDAHGGYDRQRRRQRAFADIGYVLYAYYTLHVFSVLTYFKKDYIINLALPILSDKERII